MLAGRLAASSSKGVSAVVEEIKRAISASERTREVAVLPNTKAVLRDLVKSVSHKDWEKKFLWSNEGVAKINASANEIAAALASAIKEITNDVGADYFNCNQGTYPGQMGISGPYRVRVFTELSDMCPNTAEDARFVAQYLLTGNRYPESGEHEVLAELEWTPKCQKDQPVRWRAKEDDALLVASEVASTITLRFRELILERMNATDA
jgi:hypothetical protein